MKPRQINKSRFFPAAVAVFTLLLIMKNSELAMLGVKKGMERCFLTVIPALFPYMVFSEILCAFGALELIGKIMGKRVQKALGLSGGACAAVVWGLLVGFPIGTRALVKLYDDRQISGDALSRAIGFCGIPSFGFIVNAVGSTLFHSRGFGLFMYVAAISSAIICALIFHPKATALQIPSANAQKAQKSASQAFTEAMSSATGSMLLICAYVIFFSCVSYCVSNAPISRQALGCISALLEISSGSSASAAVGGIFGVVLCGFALGWSGLSVHLQALSMVGNRVSGYKIYFTQKALQALICALAALFYSIFFKFAPDSLSEVSAFNAFFSSEYAILSFVVFFFSVVASKRRLF